MNPNPYTFVGRALETYSFDENWEKGGLLRKFILEIVICGVSRREESCEN